MTIKKGDFVEMEFTGKIKSTMQIFDTNNKDVAKTYDVYDEKTDYRPMIIVVGERQIVKGLDDFIEGKDLGAYNVEVSAENAFGKKSAKLIQLYGLAEFHKHEINPFPGLEVDMDGQRGIIRTVNGGRVTVDFNHPLASHDLVYDIRLMRIVTDVKEKVEGVLRTFRVPFKNISLENGTATIHFENKFPEEITSPLAVEIKRLTGIENIEFK